MSICSSVESMQFRIIRVRFGSLKTEKRNETEYVNLETKQNETRSFNELKQHIIPRRSHPFKLYVRVYLRKCTL
jgi:hypothetical protein